MFSQGDPPNANICCFRASLHFQSQIEAVNLVEREDNCLYPACRTTVGHCLVAPVVVPVAGGAKLVDGDLLG